MTEPKTPQHAPSPGIRPDENGKQWMTLPQVFALIEEHRRGGRLSVAEALCRQVVQAQPNNAEALNTLSILRHEQGDPAEAIALLTRVTELKPEAALYFCNLTEMCRLAGRFDEAIAAGQRAIALRPEYAEALNNLGIVYYDRGDFAQAAECYRRALRAKPDFAQACSNLGNALRALGQTEDALAAYGRAIALAPRYAEAYNNRGTALREAGRLTEAEASYRQALSLRPNEPETLNNLALALADLDRKPEALELLRRAQGLNPRLAKTCVYLASVLLDLERTAEAKAAAERALALAPEDADALLVMGRVRFEANDAAGAISCYRAALARNPRLSDAYNNLGNALKELGRLEEALAAYEQALAIKPDAIGTYVNLVDSKKFKPGDPHLAAMERMLNGIERLPLKEQYRLHFALGKAQGDLKAYGQAFEHLRRANALRRSEITYDEPAVLAMFDRIAATFTRELIASKTGGGDPSPVPIFVIGMPRSGTTLVEQILASHPAVHGAGELRDLGDVVDTVKAADGRPAPFPEFITAASRETLQQLGAAYVSRLVARAPVPAPARITDKMPSNYYFVGLIHLALPNARIVHVRRTPGATCVSCFQRLFASELPHTYDLGELGRYYRKYAGLMAHWRQVLPPGAMLEVDYEAVVQDVAAQARRLIEFCGLPWDDACLSFHTTERPVKTASATQVRQPIYTSALTQWRVYEPWLGPLFEALGEDLARS